LNLPSSLKYYKAFNIFFTFPLPIPYNERERVSGRNAISTEVQLWNELRAGHKHALAQLYNLHVKALYNFGNKVCQDTALVEDAIHDLFVDIWKNHKNLSAAVSVRAYLYASLRRRIAKATDRTMSLLRFDQRWEELGLTTGSDEVRIVEAETSDEQVKKLKAHLNNLSPRQYEAIVLRFYDDLSEEQAALALGCSAGSVKRHVHLGLTWLRALVPHPVDDIDVEGV